MITYSISHSLVIIIIKQNLQRPYLVLMFPILKKILFTIFFKVMQFLCQDENVITGKFFCKLARVAKSNFLHINDSSQLFEDQTSEWMHKVKNYSTFKD